MQTDRVALRNLPPCAPTEPYVTVSLGAIDAAVVEQMHAVIQAPQAWIGQSILAVMNQVAQPFANVIIDGCVSPLSDFFLTLGESVERKSAFDAWALAQVRERQRALMVRYRTERDAYEQSALVYDVHAKRVLADKKLSSEVKQARLAETTSPGIESGIDDGAQHESFQPRRRHGSFRAHLSDGGASVHPRQRQTAQRGDHVRLPLTTLPRNTFHDPSRFFRCAMARHR